MFSKSVTKYKTQLVCRVLHPHK